MGPAPKRSGIPGALREIRRKSLITGHIVVRCRYASVARLFSGSLLVQLVALAATAHADWTTVSAESEPGRAGIEHRHVVVEDAVAGQRVAVDVAVFSSKSTALRVIDNPDGQSLGEM